MSAAVYAPSPSPRQRSSPHPRRHYKHPMTTSSMSASLVRQSMSTPRTSPVGGERARCSLAVPLVTCLVHCDTTDPRLIDIAYPILMIIGIAFRQQPPRRFPVADRHIESVIILIHYDKDIPDSRSYMEFDSIRSAMDGICHLYESALSDALTSKRDGTLPPFEGERRRKSVNYNAQDLFNYIDSMATMKALISHRTTDGTQRVSKNDVGGSLLPRDIQWIKDNLIKHLRSQLDTPSLPFHPSTSA